MLADKNRSNAKNMEIHVILSITYFFLDQLSVFKGYQSIFGEHVIIHVLNWKSGIKK